MSFAPSQKQLFRLAVLGSGRGTNLRAILDAISTGALPATVVAVCSDNAHAGILQIAREHHIPAHCIPEGPFKTKLTEEAETALASHLASFQPDLIVLAGYMRMIKAPLLDQFPHRIVNIHPSLLPAFPGLAAWEQALRANVTETGCTIHFVDSGMDSGPVIAQKRVPVLPGDTSESLHARIQVAEHQLYPEVLRRFASGQLPLPSASSA
jgi:phosphoribosylglycinamide formyltransferase-1